MENYHIWSFQEENALIKPIYERVHRRKLGFFLQLYNKNVYD